MSVSRGIFDSCNAGIDWRISRNPSSSELPSSDIASLGLVGPSGGSSMMAPVSKVGMTLCQRGGRRPAERVAHHDARPAGGLFECGDRVAHVAGDGVLPRRPVGLAVAAEIEAEHPEPLGQRRHDPVPRASERGDAVEQEDRRCRRIAVFGDVEADLAVGDLHGHGL